MRLKREIGTRMKVMTQRALSVLRRPRVVSRETMEAVIHSASSRDAVERFVLLWYNTIGRDGVRFLGQQTLKNPFDLWMYQEILYEKKPDVVIETGTHRGGSALYLAKIAAAMGHVLDVITIDFNPKLEFDAGQNRIHPVAAISTTAAATAEVRRILDEAARRLGRPPQVMVILDSDHSKANVLAELETYGPMVTAGQYLVVEDTNINGRPILPEHGPGPAEALEEYLPGHPEFTIDRSCERYMLTSNPGGWLRRQ